MTKDEEYNAERGGLIPYYITDDRQIMMMFMKPSDPKYGGKAFQIAKGKIDPGEDAREAAIREAKEELGLFAPNVESVTGLGKFGTINMFIAKIKDPNQFGKTTDETGNVIWWTPNQFEAEGRDWQRPIVSAAVRKVRSLEKL